MRALRTALLLAVVLISSGCSLLATNNCKTYAAVADLSHPFAGRPFFGSETEEDAVQAAKLHTRCEPRPRVYIEVDAGYNIHGRNGGGLYGPGLLFYGEIGFLLKDWRE